MNDLFTTILSVFLLFGLLASTSPLPGIIHHPLPGPRYFKILVKTPGNAALDGKHYMDIKDGVVGFGRGGDDFVAHINGTEQGNSYLITHGHGYGFLLEDEAPRYDFKINFNIPPTDFKAYWAVRDGILTCHLLTNGFKVFPDPNGGYIIRWDTRDEMGAPLLMRVEWCRN